MIEIWRSQTERPIEQELPGGGLQQIFASNDFSDCHGCVVLDDAAMAITEVVRGEDLLKSTARQLLLYRALGLTPPNFYHCPLVMDEAGIRLAKRHDALSLRNLRATGATPEELRENWDHIAKTNHSEP